MTLASCNVDYCSWACKYSGGSYRFLRMPSFCCSRRTDVQVAWQPQNMEFLDSSMNFLLEMPEKNRFGSEKYFQNSNLMSKVGEKSRIERVWLFRPFLCQPSRRRQAAGAPAPDARPPGLLRLKSVPRRTCCGRSTCAESLEMRTAVGSFQVATRNYVASARAAGRRTQVSVPTRTVAPVRAASEPR